MFSGHFRDDLADEADVLPVHEVEVQAFCWHPGLQVRLGLQEPAGVPAGFGGLIAAVDAGLAVAWSVAADKGAGCGSRRVEVSAGALTACC